MAGDLECATEAAAVLEEYERRHYVPWSVKSKVDFANVARLRGRVDEAVEWCRSAGWLGFALMFTSLPKTTAGIASACARNWSRAEEHHLAAIHQADITPLRISQPIARYWYAEMLGARNLPGDSARPSSSQ
jgi:hypothetical protein